MTVLDSFESIGIEEVLLEEIELGLQKLGFEIIQSYSKSTVYRIPGTDRFAILDVSNSIYSLEFRDSIIFEVDEVLRLKRIFNTSLYRIFKTEFVNRDKEVYFGIEPIIR